MQIELRLKHPGDNMGLKEVADYLLIQTIVLIINSCGKAIVCASRPPSFKAKTVKQAHACPTLKKARLKTENCPPIVF